MECQYCKKILSSKSAPDKNKKMFKNSRKKCR